MITELAAYLRIEERELDHATTARRDGANSLRKMPVDGPFYMLDRELFGHPDAYPLFTGFASRLEEAGLAARFPMDVELRQSRSSCWPSDRRSKRSRPIRA